VESFEVDQPARNEVLIETLYTTISPGTERAHLLAEENTVTRDIGFPFQPGYSNVGRVLQTGADVRQLRPGQLVASSIPHVSHALLTVLGENEGGPVRARWKSDLPPEKSFGGSPAIWPLPEGLETDLQKGCSSYCFSRVGLHGVREARIELGEAVLILGLGPIGLHAAQHARLSGGLPVLAIDPSPARRKLAEKVGIDGTYADAATFVKSGHPLMTKGPAVVIEATGLPQVIPEAFKLCARNGRVMLLGSTRGLTQNVNFYTDVHKKGLVIYGVHASTHPKQESSPGRWTNADDDSVILRLICSRRIDCNSLITHQFGAGDAPEAYRTVTESPEALAVMLDWTR
jgi:threonine dehydrogenase-like Zn-dependent dehydrogenase